MVRRNKNWKGNGWSYRHIRRPSRLGPARPKKSTKCGKRRYRSRMDAMLALANTQGSRTSNRRDEKRVYKCPECDGWHLTSMSLYKYRQISQRRDNAATTTKESASGSNDHGQSVEGRSATIPKTFDVSMDDERAIKINDAFKTLVHSDLTYNWGMSLLGKLSFHDRKSMALLKKRVVVIVGDVCSGSSLVEDRWLWYLLQKLVLDWTRDNHKISTFEDIDAVSMMIEDKLKSIVRFRDEYDETDGPGFTGAEWAVACRWMLDNDSYQACRLLEGEFNKPEDWMVAYAIEAIGATHPELVDEANHNASSDVRLRPNPFRLNEEDLRKKRMEAMKTMAMAAAVRLRK